VRGTIDGVAYGVQVDPDGPTGLDLADRLGIVRGSAHVAARLRLLDGETVKATPVGPFLRFDADDPEAVLAALMEHTDIIEVAGEAPDLLGVHEPGNVY
jgi:hypothetical protein